MGATQSTDGAALSCTFVPKYKMLRVARSDMEFLILPEKALQSFQVSTGNYVSVRDCLGRSFMVAIEKRGEMVGLGDGWSEMLKKIGCCCGDDIMMKFKSPTAWKVYVFCGSTGEQKYPMNIYDNGRSASNQVNQEPVGRRPAETMPESGARLAGVDVLVVAEGSRKRPIDVDGPNTMPSVYNSSGRAIDAATNVFFGNISSSFDLRVPLYFCVIDAVSYACDFFAMSKDFGNNYLVPILDDEGYPEVVNLVMNGDDEPYTVSFQVATDGTVVLGRGWSIFLETNFIEEGSELVFRFDLSAEDIIIHVYDF